MLQNSKSIYFLKRLFAFVDEKNKLDIIKYNKSIQKHLNVKLIDFILYSKRFILYETKTKGKEYDIINNKYIYEGEYLNGERSGKGKEFYPYYEDEKVIFEGEYLKGKRNGKGKEYFDGELKFEGEYLNGKRNGKGKEYEKVKGHILFDGEYLNGERWNGNANEYYFEGELKFKGKYLNGKKWNGKFYGPHGEIYELKFGKGTVKEYEPENKNLEFEGEYLDGKRNGKGKEYDDDGKLIFEGKYLNGNKII